MSTIDSFMGANRFLSNFAAAPVVFEGITYPTVEHAYQAAKSLIYQDRTQIASDPDPKAAKRMGRTLTLRSDWEEIKLSVMYGLLVAKFNIPTLQEQLLATGTANLIEGNSWHDNFWGDCRCGRPECEVSGENHLGEMLAEIRYDLQTALPGKPASVEPVIKIEKPKIMLTRAQHKFAGVDITFMSAKGLAQAFAPDRAWSLGYKNGEILKAGQPMKYGGIRPIGDAEYTALYLERLDKVLSDAWKWLKAQAQDGYLTVTCYCNEGCFCHTHILIDYMLERWPYLFIDGRTLLPPAPPTAPEPTLFNQLELDHTPRGVDASGIKTPAGGIKTPSPFRIGIIGSRNFSNYTLLSTKLEKVWEKYPDAVLVTGTDWEGIKSPAQGADQMGAYWARTTGRQLKVWPADWSKGRGAGFARNIDIAKDSDFIIAFWDFKSNGTRDTLNKALAMGKPCYVISFNGAKSRYLKPTDRI